MAPPPEELDDDIALEETLDADEEALTLALVTVLVEAADVLVATLALEALEPDDALALCALDAAAPPHPNASGVTSQRVGQSVEWNRSPHATPATKTPAETRTNAARIP
jgi:hypothetical protein